MYNNYMFILCYSPLDAKEFGHFHGLDGNGHACRIRNNEGSAGINLDSDDLHY
jgi:hypothetical protein